MHTTLFTSLQLTIYKLCTSQIQVDRGMQRDERLSVNDVLFTIKNSASVNMSFMTARCRLSIKRALTNHWGATSDLIVTETRGRV